MTNPYSNKKNVIKFYKKSRNIDFGLFSFDKATCWSLLTPQFYQQDPTSLGEKTGTLNLVPDSGDLFEVAVSSYLQSIHVYPVFLLCKIMSNVIIIYNYLI